MEINTLLIKSLSFIYNIDGGVNELHVSENQEEEEEEGGDDDDLEEGAPEEHQ